ncbi:MAG: F0F1 ATP synthase subunit A [Negativicutes bacterium]
MDKIGVREVIEIGGHTFNEHTILMTWITMAIIILVAILATRNLKEVPTGWQNAMEAVADLWETQVKALIGEGGVFLVPLFLTLFLYLMVANWLGLCPGMESPTNDINTTLGMAIFMSFFVNHAVGLMKQGAGHLHHFIEPFAPFIIVNLIEELSRPASLAFRLFGNILAGEVLIVIILELVPGVINWLPSTPWILFSLFVGVIQAYIFTMLSITYIAPSARTHEE